MTSTPFHIGIVEGRRPASRVLCPPGGKHSDIFGLEPEPPRYGRRRGLQAQVAQTSEAPAATNGIKPVDDSTAKTETPEACEASNSSPDDLLPATPDTSKPLDTPESADPPQATATLTVGTAETEDGTRLPDTSSATATNTKRGRVPPGGFASKLW